ncbi:MAG TPA: AAA family ATPase [Ktedonobacteraceae bacterium]|nr:AAA family ATPase [Ktedonobacteraceae bacterium]
MGDLILNSLEIRNFRGFQHLTIERLGRVNLIVGKNNIGKSSLLEALQLYARRGSLASIAEIVERDVSPLPVVPYPPGSLYSGGIPDNLLPSVRYLFYGRRDIKESLERIQIGPMNNQAEILTIEMGWYTVQIEQGGNQKWKQIQSEEFDTVDNLYPRLILQFGGQTKIEYPSELQYTVLSSSPRLRGYQEINCVSIPANGLDRGLIKLLWDQITITDLQEEVLSSLRIIAPGVQKLGFIADPAKMPSTRFLSTVQGEVEHIPIVTIKGIPERLPIRTLGDGMQRMLGIVLALVNASDGMLLIDEIENGIHYSVQPELWQVILQLAHSLNVQVFATTHSWDSIEGFQKATQEQKQEEGFLIRLGYKKSGVNAILFDEEELGIATRQQIEVR